MRNNNPVENEINVIRADFYEKTKEMSSNEKITYIKEQTASVHEKFGICTVNKTKADKQGKKETILT